ncbi:MAG: 4Fe-4S dicluster domain-containing protein [Planctomycetota bacterium]|nr:MAG: 4Fe-4S dicluster domain-containing protein [Planctomycetota bacterium]
MTDESDNKPHDRRQMFRLGLKKLMVPIANYIEDRFNVPLAGIRTVLRPPGALSEKDFLETCYRCGNCIDVCPARAIRVISSEDMDQTGTPYIDPDLAACVVCEELACMKACPSGALKSVDDPNQIEMGCARVERESCIRSRGENCRLCVEKCPMGTSAIDVDEEGEIAVKQDGCVGCGTCQFFCPTTPKSILLDPY